MASASAFLAQIQAAMNDAVAETPLLDGGVVGPAQQQSEILFSITIRNASGRVRALLISGFDQEAQVNHKVMEAVTKWNLESVG